MNNTTTPNKLLSTIKAGEAHFISTDNNVQFSP